MANTFKGPFIHRAFEVQICIVCYWSSMHMSLSCETISNFSEIGRYHPEVIIVDEVAL